MRSIFVLRLRDIADLLRPVFTDPVVLLCVVSGFVILICWLPRFLSFRRSRRRSDRRF